MYSLFVLTSAFTITLLCSFKGGMSGGGMGFLFDPAAKEEASFVLGDIMLQTKREMECKLPFAMDPVVFSYMVNEQGTIAQVCSCSNQSNDTNALSANDSIKKSPLTLNKALNNLLLEEGFDTASQNYIRSELRSGNIGLASNRLSVDSELSDVTAEDIIILNCVSSIPPTVRSRGLDALATGTVGVVTLAAGVGSRWTGGAGVVKALHPFCAIAGKHRNFIDVHLAKSRKISADVGMSIPHVFTTSWMTHEPINNYVKRFSVGNSKDLVYISKGVSIGLRMIPMVRDLKFLEEQSRQKLDDQAQKIQNSLQSALISWAETNGEGSNYTLNVPKQCLSPIGHWYEVPNLFLNGTLAKLLRDRPQLKTLVSAVFDMRSSNMLID